MMSPVVIVAVDIIVGGDGVVAASEEKMKKRRQNILDVQRFHCAYRILNMRMRLWWGGLAAEWQYDNDYKSQFGIQPKKSKLKSDGKNDVHIFLVHFNHLWMVARVWFLSLQTHNAREQPPFSRQK